MYEDDYKEVDFHKYCDICKHKELTGWESICEECLDHPVNQYTDKPVNWEVKE